MTLLSKPRKYFLMNEATTSVATTMLNLAVASCKNVWLLLHGQVKINLCTK